jgi:hypothetical protein
MSDQSEPKNSAVELQIASVAKSSARLNEVEQRLTVVTAEFNETQQRLELVTVERDHYASINARVRSNFNQVYAELQQAQRSIDALRFDCSLLGAQLSDAQRAREAIENSTIWRAFAPLRIIVSFLPGPIRGALRRARRSAHRFMAALGLLRAGRGSGDKAPATPFPPAPPAVLIPRSKHPASVPLAVQAVSDRFEALKALGVYRSPGEARRLTLVVDSLVDGHLVGGARTAIALSVCLAQHLGARLRIITRKHPAQVENIASVLAAERLVWDKDIDFVFVPHGTTRDVSMGDQEFFLATSWRVIRSVLPILGPSRIIYLMHDDERMLYPYGDDRLRCSETLGRAAVHFVISSGMLFDHLIDGAEPLHNIRERGIWFEPACPSFAGVNVCEQPTQGKRRFLFIACPHDPQDLYWRGLEAIANCLEENVLDPGEWEFHFVGDRLDELILPRCVKPSFVQNHSWPEYVEAVVRADVGLALRNSPHPGYPVLDLAASGAVVVTNQYGHKISLDRYSENIICTEPTIASLSQAVADAVHLAADVTARRTNFERSKIGNDWEATLLPVLKRLLPSD